MNRCVLQKIQESDYKKVMELYIDPNVRKYLGGPRKEETIREAFDSLLNQDESGWYWAVREQGSGEFIGMVSLDAHHDGEGHEVSFQFFPQWWGAGYATESVKEILHYGFHELKLPRIMAETQMANKPSRKLLERLGMKLIKTCDRFGAKQGIYFIDQGEWKANDVT
ncbi:GNAT family N-acetyltransferase [Mesobacillus zeae]|uniref:N-acetyltransferase n=1 Tax=Mesobacillus zeae TaxID=1917180 RepID=A0A398AYZ2_9BACI|nr:GNAT family N-acetyltransferase [Mesobacillus zeae]RID82795.1 N-acetyltransferase [Mesobacillus zeae]